MTPELRQQRRDYVVRGRCAVCGGVPHDVHEMLAGANRKAAVAEPACWLRVCRPCHDRIQGTAVDYQLAFKLLADPQNFNLDAFCTAWGRAPGAVILPYLVANVRQILIERG